LVLPRLVESRLAVSTSVKVSSDVSDSLFGVLKHGTSDFLGDFGDFFGDFGDFFGDFGDFFGDFGDFFGDFGDFLGDFWRFRLGEKQHPLPVSTLESLTSNRGDLKFSSKSPENSRFRSFSVTSNFSGGLSDFFDNCLLKMSLISSANEGRDSLFSEISETFSDLFFVTRLPLDGVGEAIFWICADWEKSPLDGAKVDSDWFKIIE